jgi:biopolymer transport protein ExbD
MSMSAGGSDRGLTNEPNVTPMIDVLLVLLIIFMMIIPLSRKAIDVQLPDPTPDKQPPPKKADQIVLEVLPGPTFQVNKEAGRQGRARSVPEGNLRPAAGKDPVHQGRSGRHVSGRDLRDGRGARRRRTGDRSNTETGGGEVAKTLTCVRGGDTTDEPFGVRPSYH